MSKKNICYCDFHTHILPGIDDGAKNIEISTALIKSEISQGVKHICFTPHFKNQCSVDDFIDIRNKSMEKLKTALNQEFKGVDLPCFYLGAEVMLDENTHKLQGLDRLCIEGTNLLLLEPIHGFWGDWILGAIFQIVAENNVKVIIAHADRYTYNKENIRILEKLVDMDCLLQFNVYTLKNKKVRHLIKFILQKEAVPLIGSDAHNITSRSVKMNKTQSKLIPFLYGKSFIDNVNIKAKTLLKKST